MIKQIKPRYCSACIHYKPKTDGFFISHFCALGIKEVSCVEKACDAGVHIHAISDEERMKYFDRGDFDNFEIPEDWDEWKVCPHCGLRPLVWIFDNGQFTMCGCGNKDKSPYGYMSIRAESIMSHYSRCGDLKDYPHDGLKQNWNHWCETGEKLFEPTGFKGKW